MISIRPSAERGHANHGWLDTQYSFSFSDYYDPKNMKSLTIKAQSNAYFKMLERNVKVKEVFQLGNHLVWVTPNNTALIVDTSTGKEELSDKEIDELFTVKK